MAPLQLAVGALCRLMPRRQSTGLARPSALLLSVTEAACSQTHGEALKGGGKKEWHLKGGTLEQLIKEELRQRKADRCPVCKALAQQPARPAVLLLPPCAPDQAGVEPQAPCAGAPQEQRWPLCAVPARSRLCSRMKEPMTLNPGTTQSRNASGCDSPEKGDDVTHIHLALPRLAYLGSSMRAVLRGKETAGGVRRTLVLNNLIPCALKEEMARVSTAPVCVLW